MRTRRFERNWCRMGREEIREAQMLRLRRFLKTRVGVFSEHYRERFAALGIDAGRVRSLGELPFTTKEDLVGEADGLPRWKRFVLVPERKKLMMQPGTVGRLLTGGKEALESEFRPVMMTSTTGRSSEPVSFLYTKWDLERLGLSGRRMMEVCDSRREWRHLNVFPFAPHLAFWQMHYAGLEFGTFCLSTGGGKVMGTAGNVALAARLNADAVTGMPTFVYHLLSIAAAEGVRWRNLKRIVLGGEKVPQGLREKLGALCADVGAHAVSVMATYGFTEAKTAWPECPAPAGSEPSGYHLFPDLGIVEVVDPETGAVMGDGEPGEIVYTSLDARGSVVLRYRTGDMIEGGLEYGACPHCGRTMPRLVGRISRVSNRKEMQLGKVKGTLVDFNALEHLLDDEPGVGAWQIELRKANDDPLDLDELVVHVEGRVGDDEAGLREAIVRRFLREAEMRPNRVEFHEPEEMRRLQGVGDVLKEERVVDRRGDGISMNPKTEVEA